MVPTEEMVSDGMDMSRRTDGDNSLVVEVRPEIPSVDESVARQIQLEEAGDALKACLDEALDNLGFICEQLRHDRDALRALDDLRGLNNRVTGLATRMGGSLC